MIVHRKALVVSKAIDSSEDRVGLNALCIDAKGRAVATNGHILLKYEKALGDAKEYPSPPNGFNILSKLGKGESVLIPLATAIEIMQATSKGKGKGRAPLPILDYFAVDVDEAKVSPPSNGKNGDQPAEAKEEEKKDPPEKTLPITLTDLESWRSWQPRKVDGYFPNWEAVWPKKGRKVKVRLSVKYLETLLSVVRSCGGDSVLLTIRKNGDTPVLVEGEGDAANVSGLIMPMRQV